MSEELPAKIKKQIEKAGLPLGGNFPFDPKLDANSKGMPIIRKDAVIHGPKKDKIGYVDSQGRIWIRDRAHAGDPDHWDVQIDRGTSYFRVDPQGNLLP